jgi:hypothetical protein
MATALVLAATTAMAGNNGKNNHQGFSYNAGASATGGSAAFVTGNGSAEYQSYSNAEQTSGFTKGKNQGTAFTYGTDSAGATGYSQRNAFGAAGAWGTRFGQSSGWSN